MMALYISSGAGRAARLLCVLLIALLMALPSVCLRAGQGLTIEVDDPKGDISFPSLDVIKLRVAVSGEGRLRVEVLLSEPLSWPKGAKWAALDVFLDTGEAGYAVGALSARYLVEIPASLSGNVTATLYVYAGSGSDWRWEPSAEVPVSIAGNVVRLTLPKSVSSKVRRLLVYACCQDASGQWSEDLAPDSGALELTARRPPETRPPPEVPPSPLLLKLANACDRYALVYYGEPAPQVFQELARRGLCKVAILHSPPMEAPPPEFKKAGIITLAYLDILGLPISMLPDVEKNHPEWILQRADGKPARYWYGQDFMCNLAIPSWRRYLAEKAAALVHAGFDGVLLDDVVTDPRLLGPPLYDTPVYNETKYGRWLDHIIELVLEIKRLTNGALVVYNAGWDVPNDELMAVCDGVLLESYLGCWSGDVNKPNYYFRPCEEILRISAKAQEYARRGKIVIALSYGPDRRTGLTCLALARLFDFYFAYATPDLQSYHDYDILNLRLGRPLGEHKQVDGCLVRFYENGIVIFNPRPKDVSVELKVPEGWGSLVDLRVNALVRVKGGKIVVHLSKLEGTILMRRETAPRREPPTLLLPLIGIAIIMAILIIAKLRRPP